MKIRVVEAELTRSTELLGYLGIFLIFSRKMDPYCQITYNKQVLTTNKVKKGGKHPVWDQVSGFISITYQEFMIPINESDGEIFINVMDDDILRDDLVSLFFY